MADHFEPCESCQLPVTVKGVDDPPGDRWMAELWMSSRWRDGPFLPDYVEHTAQRCRMFREAQEAS